MGYLIELRIGYPLKLLKQGIIDVAEKYELTYQKPETAHMSLYGSFECRKGVSIGRIKNEIEHVAGKFNSLRYYVDGFACKEGENGWAIGYHVIPSNELRQFNEELRPRLGHFTTGLPKYMLRDAKYEWYHISIAFRLSNALKDTISEDLGEIHCINEYGQCSEIVNYSNSSDPNHNPVIPNRFLPIDSLRVTLIHGSKIYAEYDLVEKRWYTRDQAKNVELLGQTWRTYRRTTGLELQTTQYQENSTIFLTSDLHLGHKNIIKYCARPFSYSNVNEMNNVLIKNWNNTVTNDDMVYFLGDLSLRSLNATMDNLNQLNGQITFIKGNHDRDNLPDSVKQQIIQYKSMTFLLIHNPKEVINDDFEGWIIHGHVHNSNLKKYPLIDFDNKRMNVSVELTNYQPIRLQKLYALMTTNTENIFSLDGYNGFLAESDIFQKHF